MPNFCSDLQVMGTLLRGNPRDSRAALWYRSAMHNNDASVAITKEDGSRWAGFLSLIQSKHFSLESKRRLNSNKRDTDLHPEILEFIKDVAYFLRKLDKKTGISPAMDEMFQEIDDKLNTSPNKGVNKAMLLELHNKFFRAKCNPDKALKSIGFLDAGSTFFKIYSEYIGQNEHLADWLVNSVTDQNSQQKILLDIALLFQKKISIKFREFCRAHPGLSTDQKAGQSQLEKELRNQISVQDILESLKNSIKEAIYSQMGTDHTTLNNDEQYSFYKDVNKLWPFMNDSHREFCNSLFMLFRVHPQSNVWEQPSQNFGETNVPENERGYFRINIKRGANRLPVFYDSLPSLDTNAITGIPDANILRDTFMAAYNTSLKRSVASNSKTFSLRFDNKMFNAVLEDINRNCTNQERPDPANEDLTTDYEMRGGELYKRIGEKYVPFDLQVANLSEDQKCHSLGMGVGAPYCNRILECFMSGGGLSELSACEDVLSNKTIFSSIKDEIDFVHPQLVGMTLDRFEFDTIPRHNVNKKVVNPKNSGNYWIYESVDDWLKKLKGKLADEKIKQKYYDMINANASFKRYLNLLVKHVEENPIGCTKNRLGEDDRAEKSHKSAFAEATKLKWFVSRQNPQVKYYSLRSPIQIKSVIRRSDSNAQMFVPQTGYSPFVGLPAMPRSAFIMNQSGGGDKEPFTNEEACSKALYLAYQEQLKRLQRMGKKLAPKVQQKIMSNLHKIAPLNRRIQRSVMELANFNLTASYYQDTNSEEIDDKRLADIMAKHNKFFDSYQRKIGRHRGVLSGMAMEIVKAQSGKIPDDPEKARTFKLSFE